ncbi:MAG: FAD-binding and (Fe-S)-binding domain-containing protein [Bacteroidales bacterium]
MISGKYKEFYERLNTLIPKERLLHDALSTLAFGTDASFYRLIPKLIVRAQNEHEIEFIIKAAYQMEIPVTFRAAGTSLSGQALSNSVLVIASHGFSGHKILDNGLKIALQPGIRGEHANRYLAKYGRKIGPDPASIDSAMIGGIAANNASGMCCGTSENSYKTIADIKIILSDGTVLDTANEDSKKAFKKSHATLLLKLEEIWSRIDKNEELKARIKKKYKIKNTTGYSLNAFVDYNNGIDILKHIIIGSEGTLAFISEITYNTVIEYKYKALALIIYPNIKDACSAVQILKQQHVSAVELIDRASIKSVDSTPGLPEYIKTLSSEACGLLVETRGENDDILNGNIGDITESINDIKTEIPFIFTKNVKEQAILWKIRKETLPTVAGMRKAGTTAIIEDICFPVPKLADAVLDLRKIFEEDGYADAVIFGHALEGNLHFMFNQNFQTETEIEKYGKFMDDIANLVVDKYDGSLKAEHGTGRNMAPYVEKEWGKQAYGLMKEIKAILDPKEILNPGVILNSNHKIHLQNLKPCPPTSETVDKCMECGFCEGVCVAEGLTLSPRQRVASFREMERLKTTGETPHIAAEMQKQYKYWGMDTCATDSLCALKCPVKVDSGKLIKELRHKSHSSKLEKRAVTVASNMDKVTAGMRIGLNIAYGARLAIGKKTFGVIASTARGITCGAIPMWNEHFPKGARKIKYSNIAPKVSIGKVVYFPSCITRSMGVSKSYSKELEITNLTHKLLIKAGYKVIYPNNLDKLCCGMAFSSKGFVEAGKKASDELKAELLKASDNGKYPILCDMSPCLYTMHTNMEDELKLFEPAEFVMKYIIGKLKITKLPIKVAVFAVCSAKKLGVDNALYDIAKMCAQEVVIIESNCCGFAGDRGFLLPELNAHGLRHLKEQVDGYCTDGSKQTPCTDGYATSRTCEIGLSHNSGITFRSILYLLDEASEPMQNS